MANFMEIMKNSNAVKKASTETETVKKPLPSFLIPKKEVQVEKTEEAKEESVTKSDELETAKESETSTENLTLVANESTDIVIENQEKNEQTSVESKTSSIEEAVKEVDKKESTEIVEVKEGVKEKPKRGRKPRAKAPTPVAENIEEIIAEEIEFEKAVTIVSSKVVDTEWETLKQELSEKFNAIEITSDMDVTKSKKALADLNTVYQMAWFEYQASKSLYENLASKDPEGKIREVKKLNSSEGSNAESREKAGILACKHYKPNGSDEAVDLFELFEIANVRYTFLDTIMKGIEFKRNLLITMNGLLKLEADLLK